MFSIFRIFRKIIFYTLILLVLWYWATRDREPISTPDEIVSEEDKPQTPPVSLPSGEVIATPPPRMVFGPVDHIYVDKSARVLGLFSEGKLVKEYKVALGFSPEGQKFKEGDGKTPTGEYIIDWRNENSSFYRSLHISYPRPDQKAKAKSEGRDPGGMIMIHGQPNNSPFIGNLKIPTDWTNGCISVSNNEMDEIWRLVKNGTKITIVE